jgi:hypothetical protein
MSLRYSAHYLLRRLHEESGNITEYLGLRLIDQLILFNPKAVITSELNRESQTLNLVTRFFHLFLGIAAQVPKTKVNFERCMSSIDFRDIAAVLFSLLNVRDEHSTCSCCLR